MGLLARRLREQRQAGGAGDRGGNEDQMDAWDSRAALSIYAVETDAGSPPNPDLIKIDETEQGPGADVDAFTPVPLGPNISVAAFCP